MQIVIGGVSCVGKTTTGEHLAMMLGYPFRDLDKKIERYFGKPLEGIRCNFLTEYAFREKAAQVLKCLCEDATLRNVVIALPPSGLMDHYWRVIKSKGCLAVVLTASPQAILSRIAFYNANSQPIARQLTPDQSDYYLEEIKKDIAYFGRSFKRAAVRVDVTDSDPKASARKVLLALKSKPY